MINNLLPVYYKAASDNPQYTILRSIMIEGHEVAWIEYQGTVMNDILEQGNEGKPYQGRKLQCECDFTQGVGWDAENGRFYSIHRQELCIYRQAALHLRHLELRREYLKRFKEAHGQTLLLIPYLPEILFDLIEKVKDGEFIEDGTSAQSWGGYFYLQTIDSIIDCGMTPVFETANQLVEKKKISLEGTMVQSYREPLPET